jgi:hypothetical protein
MEDHTLANVPAVSELHDELYDPDDEDQWLAEFEAADRHAAGVLREALAAHRGIPAPEGELPEAAERVRAGLESRQYPFDWIANAVGHEGPPPADDAELILACTAATISPREDTGLDAEEEAMLMSLQHADWLGAIVSAVRAGPGTPATASELTAGIRTCPEVNSVNLDEDDDQLVETTFEMVTLAWSALGLIDRDDRLTSLGAWVLPRGLARAWETDFDSDGGG